MTRPPGADLEQVVVVKDGRVFATTRDIAALFGKRHDHVLDTVRKIVGKTTTPDFSGVGQNQHVNAWFREYRWVDGIGKEQTAYEVTEEGFSLLAMGFTGEKALEFKIRLIRRFKELEAQVRAQAAPPAADLFGAPAPVIAESLGRKARSEVGGIVNALNRAREREHREWLTATLRADREGIANELLATKSRVATYDTRVLILESQQARSARPVEPAVLEDDAACWATPRDKLRITKVPDGHHRPRTAALSSRLRKHCAAMGRPDWVRHPSTSRTPSTATPKNPGARPAAERSITSRSSRSSWRRSPRMAPLKPPAD
jgi:Rha family phage regulatory protein